MQEPDDLDWRTEFSDTDLPAVRTAIAQAIHNCQERSARAHTEYADPDGEQDVYGVGMSRGGPKELRLFSPSSRPIGKSELKGPVAL